MSSQYDIVSNLNDYEEDNFLNAKRQENPKWTIFKLGYHFLVGIVIFFAFSFTFTKLQQVNTNRSPAPDLLHWNPPSTCGHTAEEATARGCIYDEVLLHWMPQECSSSELIDEFLHVWPWEFWTDKTATKQITLDQVRQGTQLEKWVTFGLHKWHCAATWKILSSAAALGKTVPAFAMNWNHTIHCTDHVLMNMHMHHSGNLLKVNSHLDIEYTPCVPLARDATIKRGSL